MKSASATATAFPVPMRGEAFPVSMEGQRVRVKRPYYECSVSSLERRDEHSTLLKLQSSVKFPPLDVGEKLLLEGHGLRCDCSVHWCQEEVFVAVQDCQGQISWVRQVEVSAAVHQISWVRQEEVFVAVQDCQVRPCSACASLELPMPVPLLLDGLKDKTVRFSRLGLQNITDTEASVIKVMGCGPSLSIVRLKILAAPPPFCMGDLLVLESLDGRRQWQADVRSDLEWKAYVDSGFPDGGNENSFISVHVRTAEANRGPRLLPQKSMVISVLPVPNSYHLTDNRRGAALRKASKATVDETHIAKPKIKIGINSYGSTGRDIVRIALESEDVELVAINDSTITMDQMTCMFRDRYGQWLSSFKMKDEDPNTLLYGDKEVTIFRFKEPDKIPWNKAGAEYIVEAHADESSADYKAHTSECTHYANVNIFGNHLSPLIKIFRDRFGMVEDADAACRAPILHIIPQNPNAAKAIGEELPRWIGNREAMIFRVPAVDAPPIDLAIILARFEEYRLILSNTKPSSGFCMLLAWCVEMTRQISDVSYCELKYGVKLATGRRL